MGLLTRIARLFGASGEEVDTTTEAEQRVAAPKVVSRAEQVRNNQPLAPTASTPVAKRRSQPARRKQDASLASLSGGADRIAVVDCETTGVYPTDRIVELAIVTLSLEGHVLEAWETLVQPTRDIGATHIHGLTASCVADAPEFGDIAADVALRLDGACLAAHNFPFDYRMIHGEFDRIGARFHADRGIDTLRASGERLGTACAEYDIPLLGAHTAIDDAQATAALLTRVLNNCEPGTPAVAKAGVGRTSRVYRRADTTPVVVPDPPAIAALATKLQHAGAEPDAIGYLEILGRALADLHLDARERTHLRTYANDIGLDSHQVQQAHRRFLNELIDEAVEDEVVTPEELDQLVRVAAALEIDAEVIDRRIHRHTRGEIEIAIEPGLTIVFTGESEEGERDRLVRHAQSLGLNVAKNVTKAADLLISADADSQSGKAKKAQRYDIPITTTSAFANAQAGQTVTAIGSTTQSLKAVTCPDCLAIWTVPARSGAQAKKRCRDCARAPQSTTKRAATSSASPFEGLTCTRCGQQWERQVTRGRKPKLCPDCRASQ